MGCIGVETPPSAADVTSDGYEKFGVAARGCAFSICRMTSGLDTLNDKEKDALRLRLRGHDAKSSARALGLSVHTVN